MQWTTYQYNSVNAPFSRTQKKFWNISESKKEILSAFYPSLDRPFIVKGHLSKNYFLTFSSKKIPTEYTIFDKILMLDVIYIKILNYLYFPEFFVSALTRPFASIILWFSIKTCLFMFNCVPVDQSRRYMSI